ncbi:hypothetical protein B0F90DRAFT_1777089 [Multifurca ochricompacta]|uniref:Uncharacterized protein n=1 Tax=Multifurca ochricompacta TaxID=376703 RepID=A0AAD4QJ83_9AGAM|nr:hypothetical protein B0F90DRAFT_1777089 [Multifurca ochricompacta]
MTITNKRRISSFNGSYHLLIYGFFLDLRSIPLLSEQRSHRPHEPSLSPFFVPQRGVMLSFVWLSLNMSSSIIMHAMRFLPKKKIDSRSRFTRTRSSAPSISFFRSVICTVRTIESGFVAMTKSIMVGGEISSKSSPENVWPPPPPSIGAIPRFNSASRDN